MDKHEPSISTENSIEIKDSSTLAKPSVRIVADVDEDTTDYKFFKPGGRIQSAAPAGPTKALRLLLPVMGSVASSEVSKDVHPMFRQYERGRKRRPCQWCKDLDCKHCRCGSLPGCLHARGIMCREERYGTRLVCNRCAYRSFDLSQKKGIGVGSSSSEATVAAEVEGIIPQGKITAALSPRCPQCELDNCEHCQCRRDACRAESHDHESPYRWCCSKVDALLDTEPRYCIDCSSASSVASPPSLAREKSTSSPGARPPPKNAKIGPNARVAASKIEMHPPQAGQAMSPRAGGWFHPRFQPYMPMQMLPMTIPMVMLANPMNCCAWCSQVINTSVALDEYHAELLRSQHQATCSLMWYIARRLGPWPY